MPVPVAEPVAVTTRLTAAQGLLNLGLYEEAEQAVARVLVELPDPATRPEQPAAEGGRVEAESGSAETESGDEAGGDEAGGDAGPPRLEAVWGRLIVARARNGRGDPVRANLELDLVADLLDENTAPAVRANYHTERSQAARGLGDLNGAVAHARSAILEQPTYSRVYANAALLLHESGRLAEAIEVLNAALEIAGDFTYFVRREALRRIPYSIGRNWRGVPRSPGLPGRESAKGTRACRGSGGRPDVSRAGCRKTCAIWPRLDCLKSNLQRRK